MERFKSIFSVEIYMKYEEFFGRNSEEVARDLLGRYISRKSDGKIIVAEILQTGAYEGGNETDARQGMKYGPGNIFLLPYRGSLLLNFATGESGEPSCVEIRNVLSSQGEIKGPGAVSNFLSLDKSLEGIMLGKELQIVGEPEKRPGIKRTKGSPENCLGYFSLK